MHSRNVSRALMGAALLALASNYASAVTLQWTGNTTTAWNVADNWNTTAGAVSANIPAPGDVASFTNLATGSGTISVATNAGVDANTTVGQLLFGTNANNVNGFNPVLSRAVELSGGTITLNGVQGGSNYVGIARPEGNFGAATINNNLIISNTSATELRFNIENGTTTPTVTPANGPITINGTIGGAGGLHKTWAGTLVLNGNTNYTGLTTVRTGIVELNGTSTATGGVTVLANGRLAGSGTIVGNATVGGGSVSVTPGSATGSVATFTITGNATFQQSTIGIDLNAANGGASDLLSVSGQLSLAGNTTIALNALQPLDASAYVIANYGTLAGAYTLSTVTGLPAGYAVDFNYNGLNQIAVVAVLEPGMLSAAGLLSLGFVRVARRRRMA